METKGIPLSHTIKISLLVTLSLLHLFIPAQTLAYSDIYVNCTIYDSRYNETYPEPESAGTYEEDAEYDKEMEYDECEEYEEPSYCDEYEKYEPEELIPVFEYEVFTPFNTVFVYNWAQLSSAMATAPDNLQLTIYIQNDIVAMGGAIIIPPDRDIVLRSNRPGAYTLYQLQPSGNHRHFLVYGTLHLKNITLSGNATPLPTLTNVRGGIEVRGGSLYMYDGSAIVNNRGPAGSTANPNAGGVRLGVGAEFTMYGGDISDNFVTGTGSPGGVYVSESAMFYMKGGTIRNNTGRFGGGVRLGLPGGDLFAHMHMSGGEIYGNDALFGGGLNIERGVLTMTGGVIRDNMVTSLNNNDIGLHAGRGGGGVLIQNSGRLYMNGGIIRNNHSMNHGGGVLIVGGTMYMTTADSVIYDNTAVNDGGGVSVRVNGSAFNMSNGVITDNEAQNGGGIAALNNVAINMSGGSIEYNTAAVNGGGVSLLANTILFSVSGGNITENTAEYDGGGIWLNSGVINNHLTGAGTGTRLFMTFGTISNNHAGRDGGGIFAAPTSTVNPIIANDYRNISIANTSIFSGNTAGRGLFAPPYNANSRNFGYWLTNYDINYRGPNRLVIFNLNGGHVDNNADNIIYRVPLGRIGDTNIALPVPKRQNHTFEGWRYTGQASVISNLTGEDVLEFVVTESVTFTAQWTPIAQPTPTPTPAPSTPTPVPSTPTPTHSTPTPPPTNNGPGGSGSNGNGTGPDRNRTSPTPSPTPNTKATTEPTPEPPAIPMPQPDMHFHARFMIGYPDGNFMPGGNITRAETAALLVRTMTTNFGVNVPRAPTASIAGMFSDVPTGAWYFEYLNMAYSYGLIEGFPDGSFRPDAPITREQFAAMLARTITIQTDVNLPFTDAANISDWALNYARTTLASGWMHGDAEGTFRPQTPITRAEAAAAMNRILGRGDTTTRSIEGVPNVIIFPDAANADLWYFYYVVEATNSHWFIKDGQEEIWIEVRTYS